ncbi:molybdopterin molybdotransferase MoeA [Paenibacillus aurantiacus]|uniref:Molybdopterin molybdenumtransferase n=1 Tax=Paenibacillus aurantiacus TaxID=1936118 RepID=A0ABV5KI45_9BACL
MEQLQGASRFNRRAIKVEEAQRRILHACVHGRVEHVPIGQAIGRRLAASLTATNDWPPFARSGLDGYAVLSADTVGASPSQPVQLAVIDQVAAGELTKRSVHTGTAVRIMTGAAVPEGADAVVMLEQTVALERDGQAWVGIKQSAGAGQNVARAGQEFHEGDAIAVRGALVRPGHIALLATFGYEKVPVYARPKVGILSTGSELLPVGADLAPGLIRDSNSVMIAALVKEAGGEAYTIGRITDDLAAVREALFQAADEYDLLLTTGGVSVGDYDVMAAFMRELEYGGEEGSAVLTRTSSSEDATILLHPRTEIGEAADAIARANEGQGEGTAREGQEARDASDCTKMPKSGAETEGGRIGDSGTSLLFNKVAMRPGSPTSAGLVGGKPLIALSGNPGACYVGFELFARPVLKRLQGVSEAAARPRTTTATLTADFDKGSPHERFVRTRLFVKDGIQFADPLAFNKSSMMASLPDSDGFICIPAGPSGASAGSLVEVIVLQD